MTLAECTVLCYYHVISGTFHHSSFHQADSRCTAQSFCFQSSQLGWYFRATCSTVYKCNKRFLFFSTSSINPENNSIRIWLYFSILTDVVDLQVSAGKFTPSGQSTEMTQVTKTCLDLRFR